MTEQSASPSTLLQVRDLKVHFQQTQGYFFPKATEPIRAVDGVSFSIQQGTTLGLVGESGCGKSTTARAILRLIPITEGYIELDGCDLRTLPPSALRSKRRDFQIIFQDPYASLHPRMTVEQIICEPLRNFGIGTPSSRRQRMYQLLDEVGLPRYAAARYPHEFSGGQRQRISIARTLAPQPKLVVCDEPVSALDVSVQAQILTLLQRLQKEHQLTYLFISHDLAVVRYICDQIAVMQKGKIVEHKKAELIFKNPENTYTKTLLQAIPSPRPTQRKQHKT